ncbi:type VI secretion system tube protein TssD [Hymenobacter glaciei]
MASFHAELHLAGTSYRVVRCHYACHQPTDAQGRVNAKVRHDLLHLALDVPDGDALLAWAADPFKAQAGEVVFYNATQLVALETIAFAAGQCVGYHESFESGAGRDGAYVCQLTLTAPAFELRSGGAPAAAAAVTASLQTAADVAAKAKAAAAKVARAAATAEALATAAATLAGKSVADIAGAGAAAAAAVILPAGLPTGFVAEHSLQEFARTIGGAQHMLPPEVIDQLYQLFNAASAASVPGQPSLAHWKAVENLMRSSYYVDPKDGDMKPLNGHWPPGNGGYQRQTVQLKKGDTYDRYQGTVFNKTSNPVPGEPDLDHVTGDVFDVKFGGNFVSPLGKAGMPNSPQSFESRALNMAEDQYPFKYTIEILQDVPTGAVYGELANVIPWYGQPGGGTQLDIRFPKEYPKGEKWKYEEWKQMQRQGFAKIELQSSPNDQFEVLPKNKVRQLKDQPKKLV